MRPDDAIWTRSHVKEHVGRDLDRSILFWSAVIPIGLLVLAIVGILWSVEAPTILEGTVMP
jgi:molybdate transport system regulatory protein